MSEPFLRYRNVAFFSAAIFAALALAEWLFDLTGSGLSIFDKKGAGQVTLLAVPLVMLAPFVALVGGKPWRVFSIYGRNARRALAGFGMFWLVTTLIVVAGYLGFAAIGAVQWSATGIAALSFAVAMKTVIALLVVVILATTEETIFRMFLMRYLAWNAGRAALISAVIVASLIFAALHNLTDPLAWFTPELFPLFVGLFILGILLCVTYLATGSITCAIGVHAGFLGSKVFLRQTKLVDVDPNMLMLQDTFDLRMSPFVWALFAAFAVVIWLLRHRLRPRFAIERDLHELIPIEYARSR
jgi:membrane protease YdiL (CAAX protease family)